jgi:hypothetical protein
MNMHGLELGLLILESVLLMATMFLLVMSIREGRGRDSLIRQVESATKILTRHEYFFTVADSMLDAKNEIVAYITGRRPTGDDTRRLREITAIVERLSASGVRVKYNLPKFQDRLYTGWLYTQAGAEVRFGSCPLLHDFRYTVVDHGLAIIGVPETVGEKQATKKGYRIPSEGLAGVLSRHFYECWEGSLTYEEYLRQTIKQTGAHPGMLSKELGIDEEEIERVAGSDAQGGS